MGAVKLPVVMSRQVIVVAVAKAARDWESSGEGVEDRIDSDIMISFREIVQNVVSHSTGHHLVR